MQNFFGNSLFGNSFFDDFFSPVPSLMGRMLVEDPFDDFFADMPALQAAPAQQAESARQERKTDDLVGREDQNWFSYQRKLNALRMEMKKAVHEENFERAAQLRDEIHQLEAEHKESK